MDSRSDGRSSTAARVRHPQTTSVDRDLGRARRLYGDDARPTAAPNRHGTRSCVRRLYSEHARHGVDVGDRTRRRRPGSSSSRVGVAGAAMIGNELVDWIGRLSMRTVVILATGLFVSGFVLPFIIPTAAGWVVPRGPVTPAVLDPCLLRDRRRRRPRAATTTRRSAPRVDRRPQRAHWGSSSRTTSRRSTKGARQRHVPRWRERRARGHVKVPTRGQEKSPVPRR